MAQPCDFPTIHSFLLKLPKQLKRPQIEQMVRRGLEIFEHVDPAKLQRYANINLPVR
jgi:hypothetical protein